MASAFMGGMLWRLLGLTSLLLFVSSDRPALGNPGRPPNISPAEQEFIRSHWRHPIAPQGAAPARFSPLERSLAPASCGTCHPDQFRDWQSSLHAKSMGPGISGQLAEMIKSEPAAARSCFTCHAPLAEQAPLIRGSEGLVPNPDLDTELQSLGVVCASCHVRGHQRFGPPRRDGTVANRAPRESLPHNGLTRTTAFPRSEFCASCHQFAPNGLALNGKLLENTFEEWRTSPAARRGQQCQDCHMPDRRHVWRGIHDPEMVKSGVQIKLVTGRARYRPGETLTARLTIASTGVGHAFPHMSRRACSCARSSLIWVASRFREAGRSALSDARCPSTSRELADTRIPPGGGSRWVCPSARSPGTPSPRERHGIPGPLLHGVLQIPPRQRRGRRRGADPRRHWTRRGGQRSSSSSARRRSCKRARPGRAGEARCRRQGGEGGQDISVFQHVLERRVVAIDDLQAIELIRNVKRCHDLADRGLVGPLEGHPVARRSRGEITPESGEQAHLTFT